MKPTRVFLALATVLFTFAPFANADETKDRWIGTFSSKQTDFVTVKRLSFTKEKDGSMQVHGALVGFPDEVSIGEATADFYANRNDKPHPDVIVASFSSNRFKPLMILRGYNLNLEKFNSVEFTCYLTDADGAKVHVNGMLERE